MSFNSDITKIPFSFKYDCGWEPEVTYTGFTTVIRFPTAPWIPGHFYYVTMDSGVVSGTEFCASAVAVMYPKDFEEACKQPIPIQALVMYTSFTKFSNIFDQSEINAKKTHQLRMKNILRH
ncbi:hypothetical protein I4U23_001650 [Adineta vaga]|nr:hypothetical protein I4U23_001650 [Adineta vaga]